MLHTKLAEETFSQEPVVLIYAVGSLLEPIHEQTWCCNSTQGLKTREHLSNPYLLKGLRVEWLFAVRKALDKKAWKLRLASYVCKCRCRTHYIWISGFFQIHFESMGSSLIWFDPWLSSPDDYTWAPSAPSHPQCLQLSISAFGNNKGLSFGSFFPFRIGQDPELFLRRAHPSDLRLEEITLNVRAAWGLDLGSFVSALHSASLVVCSRGVWDRYGAKHGKTPAFVLDC